MAAALSIAYSPTPLPANTKLAIYATRPVSPGVSFMPDSEYRLITITAAAAASPANILTAYQGVWGVQPLATQKVFVKAVAIDSTGQASPALINSAIAT